MTDLSGKIPRLYCIYIFCEILSWLPVKSILRFRCVCKSWLHLISSSYFTEIHFRRAGRDSSKELRLLAPHDDPLNFIDSEFPIINNGPAEARILEMPSSICAYSLRFVHFVGSCNGLICLGDRDGSILNLMLWNPCTRETFWLPKQPPVFDSNSNSGFYPSLYGFGYDPTTQDYKVIVGYKCLITKRRHLAALGVYSVTKIVVFSLNTNSWSIIKVLKPVRVFGEGCLLNGALHWLDVRHEDVTTSKIMSFDLAEDKFQEGVVPLDLSTMCTLEGIRSSSSITNVGIGVTTGNRLFVYLNNRVRNEGIAVTIWVMNEYGVKKSWTKLVQIASESIPVEQKNQWVGTHPKWISEDRREVFLAAGYEGKALGSYNMKDKAYRTVLHSFFPSSSVLYVRTLVSPKRKT